MYNVNYNLFLCMNITCIFAKTISHYNKRLLTVEYRSYYLTEYFFENN